MTKGSTRRGAFKALLAGSLAVPRVVRAAQVPTGSGNSQSPAKCRPAPRWAAGIEGQRKADLGDGTFLNPIIAGDHPDPTVLKDGDDYYMTFSSFVSYPGVVIWHSPDLVNWTPVGPALKKPIGSVWAMDLIKHDGRYFIYIPRSRSATARSRASTSSGPTTSAGRGAIRSTSSSPGRIDPGHAVGEDGKRYLFVNGIRGCG